MTELETLRAEEDRLHLIWSQARAAYDKAVDDWTTVIHRIQTIETMEKIRAEILAEMAAVKPAAEPTCESVEEREV
jgi:hypothetical protein